MLLHFCGKHGLSVQLGPDFVTALATLPQRLRLTHEIRRHWAAAA